MSDKSKLKDRARDELFSHINRCGVLQAAAEDQRHWMDETMEYLGERYPDLSETDLRELYTLGIRFCSPAIPHGRPTVGGDEDGVEVEAEVVGETEVAEVTEVTKDSEPMEAAGAA